MSTRLGHVAVIDMDHDSMCRDLCVARLAAAVMDAPPVVARPAGAGVARLAIAAEAMPEVAGAAPLWRLNSGAAMLTRVEGINQGALILLVIDLASVTFAAPEIDIMREHYTGPIGRWTSLIATLNGPKGPGIYGSPIFYTSTDEAERGMYLLAQADEVAALLKRKHPWQASVEIGATVENYELIPPGASVELNGATYTAPSGPNDPPMYVIHNGVSGEASVCLRGADTDTGPTLFASRTSGTTPTPESSMDLKALLAKYAPAQHGHVALLFSEGKKPEEIATALLAEESKGKDDEITKLNSDLAAANKAKVDAQAASDAKIAELQGKIDALKTPGDEGDKGDKGLPPAGGDGGKGQHAAPKTVTAGMAQLSREGSKATGFDLRKAALAKWPSLRATIPKA